MSTLSLSQAPAVLLLKDIRVAPNLLWRSMLAMAAGALICLALAMIDTRLFNGISVWDKPAKFFLSLTVQYGTVGFALSLLPAHQRETRGVHITLWTMVICGWLEMAYIIFRAARGEASHFNASSIFAQIAYAVMGAGALTITATGFLIGLRVWRARGADLMTEAAGLGLMLGMLLGTGAGLYLSQQHGHWVGGEANDAHGLGFFSWSTTGGDLRVPHFVGLHSAQVLPLAALSGNRRWVYVAAAACIAATALTFLQATMGIPLLRG